jgi:SET and MYND domain-containing protein
MPVATSPKSALQISTLPNKGRCFIAKRDIKAGELLLRASPYAAIADTASKRVLCANCLDVQDLGNSESEMLAAPLLRCLCCDSIRYCSQECQKEDWPIHETECEFLATVFRGLQSQLSEYQQDYIRLLMRCLIRNDLEIRNEKETCSDGLVFGDVWKLCDNASDFDKDTVADFHVAAGILHQFAQTLQSYKENESLYSKENLFLLVCKEECNSFGLYKHSPGEYKRPYGLALYPEAVYFNHSCCPNVVHTTLGKDELFFSAMDIKEGEELTITYIDIRKPVSKRNSELKSVFLFTCDCQRCVVEKSSDSGNQTTLSEIQKRIRLYLCQEKFCQGVYLPFDKMKMKDHLIEKLQVLEWTCEACSTSRSL